LLLFEVLLSVDVMHCFGSFRDTVRQATEDFGREDPDLKMLASVLCARASHVCPYIASIASFFKCQR
jgi:hypothetical protein